MTLGRILAATAAAQAVDLIGQHADGWWHLYAVAVLAAALLALTHREAQP